MLGIEAVSARIDELWEQWKPRTTLKPGWGWTASGWSGGERPWWSNARTAEHGENTTNYLEELANKPQSARQVVPELGEPYGRWTRRHS